MVAVKADTVLNDTGTKPAAPAQPLKAKFTIFGEEMIGKEVKPGGNAGRVYLPLNWVGKRIKIIRVD
jgi:putative transposon-encoded protein